MVKKIVLSLVLVCLLQPVFADEGDDQMAYERAIHTLKFDVSKGQAALRNFLKSHPQSNFRRNAYLQLYHSFDHSLAQKKAALQVLQDFQNSPNIGDVQGEIWRLLSKDYGWEKTVRGPLKREEFLEIPLSASSGPDSEYSLFKISDKDYFAALKKRALTTKKTAIRMRPQSSDFPVRAAIPYPRSIEFKGPRKLVKTFRIKKWSKPNRKYRYWNTMIRQGTWRLPKQLTGAFVLRETMGGFHFDQILVVPSFGVVAKPIGRKILVFAVNPVTGKGIPGVKLTYLAGSKQWNRITGADGCTLFDTDKAGRIIAERGLEVRLCDFNHKDSADVELVYISTDRPIYRPGQTVHFKGIHRKLQNSKLTFRANDSVKVEIRDPNDRVVKSFTKTWSDFGTLSDSFQLAAEPALGTYLVVIRVQRTKVHHPGVLRFDDDEDSDFWTKEFQVRSYRKPYGKVTITMEKAATPGGSAKARIHAEYFHGGPVKNATVNWSVYKTYVWKDHTDLTYKYAPPFNDPLKWIYDESYIPSDWDFDYDDESTKEGEGVTNANGDLIVEFPMKVTKEAVHYTIEANVEDDSRLAVAATKVLKFNESSVKLSVGSKTMFGVDGEPLIAIVKAQDAAGQPRPNTKVQLTVFLAEDPFGRYGAEFESLKKIDLVTNSEGLAECPVVLTGSGRIRLRARTLDNHKRKVEARSEVWSAGPNVLDPKYEGAYLDIIPEKAVFKHGEQARFLVRANSYPLQALITIEGRELLDYRVLTIRKASQIITLPMKAHFGSNVDVRLQAWKNDQSYGAGFNVYLHSAEKEVNVTVTTDKKSYGPGEEATILVETRVAGQGQASELEFVIVDNKIFELMPDLSDDLRRFFLVVPFPISKVFSSLAVTQDRAQIGDVEAMDPNGGGGGGGGGGVLTFDDEESEDNGVGVGSEKLMEMMDRVKENAAFENAPALTRKWFPDTMIFKGHATTNPQGKKVFKLKMPDSLTSWRILARAVTKKHQFGYGSSDVLTRKDILVRLVTPRFYTVGDKGAISTIIHNNSQKAAVFTVSLTSKELDVEGPSKIVKIGPMSESRIDWPVTTKIEGLAFLEAKALSPLGSDAVQRAIPVKSRGVKYAVSQSEFFKDTWKGELQLPKNAIKDSESLEVYIATGPGSAMKQALPFLARYPYGCVEQTMSRFLPAIVASQAIEKHGLNVGPLKEALPGMVAMSLQRLYNFQHDDGGWGWWKHDETHPFMTTYVVFGLIHAQKAGYDIDAATLKSAIEALDDLNPTPFWYYVQSLLKNKKAAEDLKEFDEIDDLSAKDLAFLVLAGRTDLAAKLPSSPPNVRRYQEIVSSALVLKAYSSLKSNDNAYAKRIQTYTDWLLQARRGQAWVTTLDSAYAVFALCDLVKKGELGDLRLKVNGHNIETKNLEQGVVVQAQYLNPGKNTIEVSGAKQRLNISTTLSYFSIEEQAVAGERKLTITRTLEKASMDNDGEKKWSKIPNGATIKRGTELRLFVELKATEDIPYIMVEAPIFAGCEAFDEDGSDDYWSDYWYKRKELRDDRVSVASPEIYEGRSELTVPLKLTSPGTYFVRPAEAYNMYDTAIRAVSKPLTITIVD